MKVQLHIGLIGAALLAVASTAYAATPVTITVLNPSFELQNASGGNQYPITDWTDANPSLGTNFVGVRYYTDAQYPNAQESSGPVGADGHQGIFDDDGLYPVYQTLSSDLSLGTYTLTVASGQRSSVSYDGGEIELYAGGVQLKSVPLIEPTAGTFTDTTLTFTATELNAAAELGKPLQIDLQSNGGAGTLDFDNVRLEFTAAPEPSTWAMVAGAGTLLVFGGRRLRNLLARA